MVEQRTSETPTTEAVIEELKQKIRTEGRVLPRGILNVSRFLNHQVDTLLMHRLGYALCTELQKYTGSNLWPTKVLTVEISGIAPAVGVGHALGAPMIFARKQRNDVMPETMLTSEAPSHTKGGKTSILVLPELLTKSDRVFIVDDFLATGETIKALIDITEQSGATLLGVGAVIEKAFENGRETLQASYPNLPIISLVTISSMDQETGISFQ
jgi:xanthine phosphoribosyltransferase